MTTERGRGIRFGGSRGMESTWPTVGLFRAVRPPTAAPTMPRPTRRSKAKHSKAGGAEEAADTRPAPYQRPVPKAQRSERKDENKQRPAPEHRQPRGPAERKERPARAPRKEGRDTDEAPKPAFRPARPPKAKPDAERAQPAAARAQPEASTSTAPAGPTAAEIAAMLKSKRPKQPFTPKQPPPGTALVITSATEPLPSPEALGKLRRLDLLNAGFDNVSWLKDAASLTWLNLNGNPVTQGWDVVGKLSELTVLNISNTGVTELPIPLRRLKSLKAFVATGNPWRELNEHVVAEWSELNSLILSHSPSLSVLPPSLSTLSHLAKLSLSHCPALTTSSFPDLSSLGLLRDIKLNHCSHLDALPTHLSTWGTGPLSASSRAKGNGHGLEVVDLGSCNLTFLTLDATFLDPKKPWESLRSLTVQSNPLCESHPDYAQRLVGAPSLPKLQIVDAKRVVERKRKGEITEKKPRVQKVREVKITGANVAMDGERRQWGPAVHEQPSEPNSKKKSRKADEQDAEPAVAVPADEAVIEPKKKKVKKAEAQPAIEPDHVPEPAPVSAAPEPEVEPVPAVAPESKAAPRTNATMKTSILKVIDVAPPRRKTTNLVEAFGKKPEADNGLGVGGW